MREMISEVAVSDAGLNEGQVASVVERTCKDDDYRDKRILLIVPDGTRTAPVGLLFQTLHRQIGLVTKAFDVLIALGTHQPMSEEAICGRLISPGRDGRTPKGRGKFSNTPGTIPQQPKNG